MGNIPTGKGERRETLPGRGISTRVSPERSGTALQELGQSVSQFSEVLAERANIQQDQQNLIHSNKVLNSYDDASRKFKVSESQRQGTDTNGWEERSIEWDRTTRQSILANTPDNLLERVNLKLDSRLGNIKDSLAVNNVRQVNIDRELTRSNSLANHIFNVGEAPALMRNEIDRYNLSIDEYMDKKVYSSEQADALIVDGSNKIAQAAADAVLNSNPALLMVQLEDGVYDGLLTQKQQDDLNSQSEVALRAIDTEQKRRAKQAEKDANDAQKKAQDATENAFITRLGDKEDPVTWIDVVQSNLGPDDKLKWQKLLNNETEEGKKIKDQLSIAKYDELTATYDSFDENTSEDVINEAWDQTRTAFGKGEDGGISQSDYNHFLKRRDSALEKSDPINSGDFKAGEARILSFEKNGGFLPWKDSDGNVVPKGTPGARQMLKKEAEGTGKGKNRDVVALDISKENSYKFMQKYKAWKQENPDEDSSKWITKEFEPVKNEVNAGIIRQTLDFWFGDVTGILTPDISDEEILGDNE